MPETSFTKLDSGIVRSSIWMEPIATRVVWIAFLATCDKNGFVAASRSGMEHISNVPHDEFESAMRALESADPDSRTPDNDGRRIEKVSGGWIILNYALYRDKQYKSERREASRIAMAKKRAADKAGENPDALPETFPGDETAVKDVWSLPLPVVGLLPGRSARLHAGPDRVPAFWATQTLYGMRPERRRVPYVRTLR